MGSIGGAIAGPLVGGLMGKMFGGGDDPQEAAMAAAQQAPRYTPEQQQMMQEVIPYITNWMSKPPKINTQRFAPARVTIGGRNFSYNPGFGGSTAPQSTGPTTMIPTAPGGAATAVAQSDPSTTTNGTEAGGGAGSGHVIRASAADPGPRPTIPNIPVVQRTDGSFYNLADLQQMIDSDQSGATGDSLYGRNITPWAQEQMNRLQGNPEFEAWRQAMADWQKKKAAAARVNANNADLEMLGMPTNQQTATPQEAQSQQTATGAEPSGPSLNLPDLPQFQNVATDANMARLNDWEALASPEIRQRLISFLQANTPQAQAALASLGRVNTDQNQQTIGSLRDVNTGENQQALGGMGRVTTDTNISRIDDPMSVFEGNDPRDYGPLQEGYDQNTLQAMRDQRLSPLNEAYEKAMKAQRAQMNRMGLGNSGFENRALFGNNDSVTSAYLDAAGNAERDLGIQSQEAARSDRQFNANQDLSRTMAAAQLMGIDNQTSLQTVQAIANLTGQDNQVILQQVQALAALTGQDNQTALQQLAARTGLVGQDNQATLQQIAAQAGLVGQDNQANLQSISALTNLMNTDNEADLRRLLAGTNLVGQDNSQAQQGWQNALGLGQWLTGREDDASRLNIANNASDQLNNINFQQQGIANALNFISGQNAQAGLMNSAYLDAYANQQAQNNANTAGWASIGQAIGGAFGNRGNGQWSEIPSSGYTPIPDLAYRGTIPQSGYQYDPYQLQFQRF